MSLHSKYVQALIRLKTFFGYSGNSQNETFFRFFIFCNFLVFASLSFAAELNSLKPVGKPTSNKEVETLIEKLRPDAIAIRKDGDTIRMRYLRGSKDLPEPVREIQTRPLKLFKDGKPSVLGPGSSGGGFSNYYSSYANTIEDINAMIGQFERMPEELLKDYLPREYHEKITAKKLSQALRKVQFSFFQEGISIAPEGLTDILEADYVLAGEESYIILLKSFFEKYNSMARSNALSIMRARTILHEITHLFGVGLNDDSKSLELSFYLVLALNSNQRDCISTADCKTRVQSLSREYNSVDEDTIRRERKAIQEKVPVSNLQLNGAISHGYSADISQLGHWYPTNLQKPDQDVLLLTSYELRNVLPKDFSKVDKNRFAVQLLASISLQSNIDFQSYLSLFDTKKSRWGSYYLMLFETEDGTLYSRHLSNVAPNNGQTEFLAARGSCYGEKLERPDYTWTLDEQNQICVGRR